MWVKMVKQPEFKEDYVVRLLNVRRHSTRDVVISVQAQAISGYSSAAYLAMGLKAKSTEIVVRVSLKGYS